MVSMNITQNSVIQGFLKIKRVSSLSVNALLQMLEDKRGTFFLQRASLIIYTFLECSSSAKDKVEVERHDEDRGVV